MSAELISSQLADFLSFKNGKSSPDRNDEAENPVYGSNGLIGYADEVNAGQQTIIIGRVGSYCGSIHYSHQQCWVTDNAIACSSKSPKDSLFWYYYLIHANLNQFRSGSGQPLLNQSTLNSIPCHVPKDEDTRSLIGEFLSEFDKKIQLNHQINQTLEQMAQAIFKSWFVDFEPVKAKIAALEAGGSEEDALLAAMQAISGKDADQLARMQAEQPEQYAELRATAELFPSAMQDSELGEIPEGWEVSEIGNEVTVVGGGTPSTKNSEFWEGGNIHWTTPKDLSNLSDKVLLDTERKITHAGLAKISSGLLPIDTVLMSSRAPVGYLALAKTPVAVNQGYIAMKCEGRLSPEFVIQWCSANMPEIKGRASGTTFAEISKKNFKIIPVIVPAKSLVSAYTASVKLLYDAIEVKVRESMNLAQLRDTLLPKLLSGELTLPGTEEPQTECQDAAHG